MTSVTAIASSPPPTLRRIAAALDAPPSTALTHPLIPDASPAAITVATIARCPVCAGMVVGGRADPAMKAKIEACCGLPGVGQRLVVDAQFRSGVGTQGVVLGQRGRHRQRQLG
jgi:hypothetical protein